LYDTRASASDRQRKDVEIIFRTNSAAGILRKN
jgi:hypothetical protein